MQQKVKSLFADRGFWRSALRLAIPIALQNLLLSSFTLVDTVMIGSLGDVPLAAVGMAGQWSWVMNILFFGVNSGASVFLAQYWGVRDVRGIQRTFGLLLVGALAPALLFTGVGLLAPGFVMRLFTKDPVVIEQGCSYLTAACFSYVALALSQAASTLLRSTEEVRLPVVASLCSVLTNALLNYALIFGRFGAPAMGLRGAAIATAIAAWVNVVVLYGAALGRRTMLRMPPRRMFAWDGAFLRHFLAISLPALVNEGMWALGTTGYNMIYGHMGTDNYAALTIFRTVENLAFVFFVGLCHACSVLIGKRIGAGDFARARLDARRFTVLMTAMSVTVGLALIALRTPLLSLFNVSEGVRGLTRQIVLLLLLHARGRRHAHRRHPGYGVRVVHRAAADVPVRHGAAPAVRGGVSHHAAQRGRRQDVLRAALLPAGSLDPSRDRAGPARGEQSIGRAKAPRRERRTRGLFFCVWGFSRRGAARAPCRCSRPGARRRAR